MKRSIRYLGVAAFVGAAVSLSPLAFGQEAVSQTTTTTSSDGTISEFTPGGDTVVLRSDAASAPIRYSYSSSTTVVDQNGNPVDISVIRSGVPVQVFYDRDGDRMIARKIIVRRTTTEPVAVPADTGVIRKDTTTTTTTQTK